MRHLKISERLAVVLAGYVGWTVYLVLWTEFDVGLWIFVMVFAALSVYVIGPAVETVCLRAWRLVRHRSVD